MDDKEKELIFNTLTELTVRISAVERLMLDKKVFSEEELRETLGNLIMDLRKAISHE